MLVLVVVFVVEFIGFFVVFVYCFYLILKKVVWCDVGFNLYRIKY